MPMPRPPTTDRQDELFDLVDREDRIIGLATRREVHRDKRLLHRAVTVLVYRGQELFLQKRSETKDMYPGCWTVSCSGHLGSGETYEAAARRELAEELGIRSPVHLRWMFKDVIEFPKETEIMAFFRCETNEEMTLNTEEISDGRFFLIDDHFLRVVLPSMETTPDLAFVIRALEADPSLSSAFSVPVDPKKFRDEDSNGSADGVAG